jgi:cellulose synthase/poly-beta-1,6-N-acetylglucosamine synthase-like glycosyltransferase/spore germination protein YaaH/peptidoglycan/xylan/chitin deacetylase (PgdA/CDA1 family)
MNNELKQIFHTSHQHRWLRFKWGGRLLLFFFAIAISILVITLVNMSKESLIIPLEGRAIKKVLTGDIPAYRESSIGKRYKGMRNYIEERWAKGHGKGQSDSMLNLSSSPFFNDSLGVRAAFYVTWNNQSFFSLRRNISKINLVLPEWFFIDGKADTLYTNIDKRAFDIIRASGVKVMPMLSNNDTGRFNGVALHRILNNKAKKERLINDVVKLLKQYNFAGINVDFEELIEKKNEALSSFQKELYQQLHSQGFLVTQNVPPFNEDYNYKVLAKYNDYLFLMAYDQYSDGSGPGPICSQKWIEAAVDKLVKDVPTSKIILNIAGYGFDWPSRGKVESITYQEALTTARESEGVVHFDNDTYNLHYNYYDDRDVLHQVYFTDAATNFNSLRFATEYGLAGTALWRLGSEDNRLWDFYNRPMTKDALRKFNFTEFNNVAGNEDVDYLGEGDILDILSTPTDGKIKLEVDTGNMIITEENYIKLPSTYVIRQWGKTNGKKLVLTYDDGPDPLYTPEILDTLSYYHVPAAFFMVGIQAENNIPLVKRIYNEGFEIGNHTFSHPNMAVVSKRRALLEMDATRLLIECITGHSTIMFRAPFNADSDPEASEEMVPIALSRSRNYITIGESIDPNDWEKADHPELNADSIFNRVVSQHKYHLENGDSSKNIILLHDAGGDRSETVKATGMIIRYFKSQGYTFTTIADLLGKKPDDMMPPVAKGTGYYLLQFNFFLAELYYIGGHLLNALFIVFLSLSAIRVLILGIAAFLQRKKEKQLLEAYSKIVKTSLPLPLVSIIVPAYNEEVNAISSLENLLRCNYPEFEIIFVDDGSMDSTLEKVNAAYGNHSRVKIFTKPNGGKSSALDLGIEKSGGDFLVCIDADTHLLPNAVGELMRNFINERVGAVAGVVKVGNEVNILTKWQSIEYISSQNFDRKGFAYLNAITVVPGAIGAFRKEALLTAGGFTTDTLAEDCDLTIRILKAGYVVANEPKAIAYTEAPETIRQFMKQRFRWSFGVMQTFWKHKELLFNDGYKSLGWIALPDILLFKYIVPFFSPLADFFMLAGIITNNPANNNMAKIGKYYLIFLLVDTIIAAIGFAFDKEKPWKLVWIIPQRLIYRWLMIIVLFRSFRRAIKGELQNWGVLKRTGNVKGTAHRAVLTS